MLAPTVGPDVPFTHPEIVAEIHGHDGRRTVPLVIPDARNGSRGNGWRRQDGYDGRVVRSSRAGCNRMRETSGETFFVFVATRLKRRWADATIRRKRETTAKNWTILSSVLARNNHFYRSNIIIITNLCNLCTLPIHCTTTVGQVINGARGRRTDWLKILRYHQKRFTPSPLPRPSRLNATTPQSST